MPSAKGSKMPSILVRILLFISSYFPLLAIFSIQNANKESYWYLIPVITGVIACIILLIFIKWVVGSAARDEVVAEIQRKDAEVMSYIVTYIFPFMDLDFADISNLLSLGIFFLILMIIYINSNLIHINPMLNLSGYHIYEIQTPQGSKHTIISKQCRLVKGTKLQVVMIGDDLFMEKK